MNILLLSAGGGGGSILRSLKSLFERDVAVTQTVDPQYAARLKSAVTTRFLDTNEFSLADVPADERLLIGRRTTGGVGARHNPEVARHCRRVIHMRDGQIHHIETAHHHEPHPAHHGSGRAALDLRDAETDASETTPLVPAHLVHL